MGVVASGVRWLDFEKLKLRHWVLFVYDVFICGLILDFLTRLALISPLRGRVFGAVFARCPSRRRSVTYFARRAVLRVKVPRAAAVYGPSAASHQLTLAHGGMKQYLLPR